MNLLLKIVVGVVLMILAGGILMPLIVRLGVFPTIIDRIERQAAYRWAADQVQKWRIDPMPPEICNILVADLAGDTWSGQQADRIVDALGDQFKVKSGGASVSIQRSLRVLTVQRWRDVAASCRSRIPIIAWT